MNQVAALLMLLATAGIAMADTRDWFAAEKGIRFDASIAYAGCTPSDSVEDEKAKKIAFLRAQANIARTKNIAVSGEEHVFTNPDGNVQYSSTISETSASTIHQVTIVEQTLAVIDGVSNLCILVVEK